MSYVSNSEIESWIGTDAYIALTDDTGSGHADEDKVDAVRQASEGEVNSYLATRYRTPVDCTDNPEVAAALKGVVLDLVAYRLHGRRPPVPEDVARRRDEAVAWLARVAEGLAQLPSITPLPETGSVGITGRAAGPNRAMTREGMADL